MVELLALAALAAAVAAICQAVTGFGFALVAVPLFGLVAGPRASVIVVTVISAILTSIASLRLRQQVRWSTARTLSLCALAGMPFGLVALALIPERALAIGIAAVVVVFAGLTFFKVPLPTSFASVVGAGLVSGAFLTSVGMNGPPLVAALHSMRFRAFQLRATLQATFAAQDLLAILGFVLIGQLTWDMLVLPAAGVPGALVGWAIGDRIFARVCPNRFRFLVIGMLFLSAALLVVQSVSV